MCGSVVDCPVIRSVKLVFVGVSESHNPGFDCPFTVFSVCQHHDVLNCLANLHYSVMLILIFPLPIRLHKKTFLGHSILKSRGHMNTSQ